VLWGGHVSYACAAPGTGHCNGYCAERLKMAGGVIAAPWISDSARSCAAGSRNWRRWRSRCRDFRLAISQRCLSPRAATQKMEPQIIQPADQRNPPPEGSYFGRNGQN
jgi:hypothetical protein